MPDLGPQSPHEWGEEYRRIRPVYETYTAELRDLLERILEANHIDRVQIDKRAKTVESFVEKIARKGDKYEVPLRDVTDLAGLRIIAYYREDLGRIDAARRSEFEIDEENYRDATRPASPDQFGYESIHYVVQLGENRSALAEWTPFAGLCAEVQVRTALQHAWAAIDHKLRYKRPRREALPPALQRDLFRLSALLELADKEFSALRRATEHAQDVYSDKVAGGQLDIPLDALSLEAYLESTNLENIWAERAMRAGLVRPDFEKYGGLEEIQQADRAYLLAVARHAGLVTVAQLHEALDDADRWGDKALRIYALLRQEQSDGLPGEAWPTDLLVILLMMKFGLRTDAVPDPQYVEDSDPRHWGGPYADGVDAAVDEFERSHGAA